MPKRTDIHKVLVIGSGPIVIGQAASFYHSYQLTFLELLNFSRDNDNIIFF